MKDIGILKVWMRAATVAEQELLAQRVDTSVGMLRQYAGGHREMSAERAGRVEAVTAEMHKLSKGRLPRIVRTDVCGACRQCPYAQKALGERAVVSEFPILSEVAP